jgi:hypothetical protein
MLRVAGLSRALVAATLLLGATAGSARAQVVVGGQPMLPSRTIVDNAVNSVDHTTLVAAVAAAGLVDTLKGVGPFTVFAPGVPSIAAGHGRSADEAREPRRADQHSHLPRGARPARFGGAARARRAGRRHGPARDREWLRLLKNSVERIVAA